MSVRTDVLATWLVVVVVVLLIDIASFPCQLQGSLLFILTCYILHVDVYLSADNLEFSSMA